MKVSSLFKSFLKIRMFYVRRKNERKDVVEALKINKINDTEIEGEKSFFKME